MKYQDLVIKNGKFVGKFDEMYQRFSDPWHLLKKNKFGQSLNYQIIFNYCDQIKKRGGRRRKMRKEKNIVLYNVT